jgi:hypothetical protein
MEVFEAGLVLFSGELSLLARILGLRLPEELPLPGGGADEAFESLQQAGILVRDERSLAVDRSVARMIQALCGKRWALTLEPVSRSQTAFGAGGFSVVVERLNERWLLTPFPTAQAALNGLAAGLEEVRGTVRARFSSPERKFDLVLPAEEMRRFLESALINTVEE